MNTRTLATALSIVVALTLVAPVSADTVYYKLPGVHGLQSVRGTMDKDADGNVTVVTSDGEAVTIDQADVYQIVLDAPEDAGSYSTVVPHPEDPTAHRGLHSKRNKQKRPYEVGILGGMNVSNMSVDPVELEDSNSLRSYAVGGWWRTPINRRVTLQTEAIYSVKGDAESANGYTASTRLAYLDVPVLARIGFRNGSPIRPSLFLGPSLAINLSARSKLEGDASDVDVDVKDKVQAFDLGLVVGGGLNFQLGGQDVGVDLRYSKGLSNAVDESANGTAHNDVIAILGSIRL